MERARAAMIVASDRPEAEKVEAIAGVGASGDQAALTLLTPPARSESDATRRPRKRHRPHQRRPGHLGGGAERLVRRLARLGAAARRDRPCHHLRRDGRHQHGAWRDGDARRLHDLRRAGDDPHLRAGAVDWSLAIALPLAFLVAGAVGLIIERSIIRWLYGRPLETLLATWGLSLILQQAVRTIFGPTNSVVDNPAWMSGAFEIGG